MEDKKDKVALDDKLLDLVAGGGTGEAEAYLSQLMGKYGCQRWDLANHMTSEEYDRYVYLYNN